jgi:hypothetical protein
MSLPMLSAVFLYVGLSSPGPGRACKRVRNNSKGDITVADTVRARHPAMNGVGVRYGCDVDVGTLTVSGVDCGKIALLAELDDDVVFVISDRRCSYPIM